MIKLNLGSKNRKLAGFDNLDQLFGWHFQDGLPKYADGSVDGITISHALMFLTQGELEKFTKEMWRVLKTGGVVRITEDDTENPKGQTYKTGNIKSKPNCLTGPEMMRQILEQTGFSVYNIDGAKTHFVDQSLIQAYRGGPPNVFFIEAIKASPPPVKISRSLQEITSTDLNPIVNVSVQYGSFLPALIKVINLTDGPVLELGMGMFSTPYLHFACYPKRQLVSYENDKEYYKWLNVFASDFHQVHFVKNWEEIDLSVGDLSSSGTWSVVLVDHEPTSRRKEEIKRLANLADYIVVHDTNPRLDHKYKFSEIYPLFKFRKDFNLEKPYTTVLSNFKDLSNL